MLRFIGEMLLDMAVVLVIVYVLGTALYSLRRRALRRKRRHDQQHYSRFPYRAIFYISMVLTLFACGFSAYLISREGLSPLVFMPGPPLLLAAWSFRGYVLQKMPSAAEAIERDPRPPVLYLRSFDQENLIFVVLKDQAKFNDLLLYADDIHLPAYERRLYQLSNSLLPIFGGWESAKIQNITFEKYFRSEVTRRIGPLIALGNPIDSLPAEGAYRDYQIDEQWKDIFYDRSSRCACILMQLGSSNNLQFELVSILTRGMLHKLFILTPPKARVYDVTAPARKYVLREKPADWRTFSEILRANGYQVPQEDLGLGAVLTFEPDGQPLILKRGAFQPDEYIGPIHERLQQLELLLGDEKPADLSDTTLK